MILHEGNYAHVMTKRSMLVLAIIRECGLEPSCWELVGACSAHWRRSSFEHCIGDAASCEIWERFYFCALPGNGAASAHQTAYLPTELADVYIIANSSHVSKTVSLVGSAMKNSTKRHAADKALRCLL